jgi:hypothetical protein
MVWKCSRYEGFRRQCLKEGNWAELLPLALIDVHDRLFRKVTSSEEYFRTPGVWEDIRPVYEEYLAKFPENNFQRSSYAYRAEPT